MKDGSIYFPTGRPAPVVAPGEFIFAAAHLEHGHIYGQSQGLIEAGATLRYVYDPDPVKVSKFRERFPQAQAVDRVERILDDPAVQLVAAAAVPCDRATLGERVLRAGKDYFTDKGPFTSLDQITAMRQTVNETGRKYMVYFSERLHSECAVFAGELIQQGAIGRVVQVMGFGPHRLEPIASRPDWFFHRAQAGGILGDIGSHQCEQFLYYGGAQNATVLSATVANTAHPEYPELQDFGEIHLLGDNGCTGFIRVDWLTPAASRTWGDGRTFILGTQGYIELRKYIEVGKGEGGDQLYLVNDTVEKHYALAGQVGFPFFGQLILDCLHRTDQAMTQAHVFKAAELCLLAQAAARQL